MGYNLYITRDRGWFDRGKAPIERSLWDAVVAADPSLTVSAEDWFERKLDMGTPERTERIYAVVWIDHPDRVPFWFVDGAVDTKNPDGATIEKMVELADKLQARVLGEEGEEYRRGGVIVPPLPADA